MSHISFYPQAFCCQWVFYSTYVPREQRSYLHSQEGIKIQRMWPIHRGFDEKFVIPHTISSLCTNVPKSFLDLIWVWLNWSEKRFMTILLPQTLCGFLMEVDKFYSDSWFPNVHISRYCTGWNREKIAVIHEGADHGFSLYEDETTTKGCGSSAL